MSRVRNQLARRVEEAFSAIGQTVTCDPASIAFPRGFYRTDVRADTYRWTAFCCVPGREVGPSVDSYDTATNCAGHGVTLDRLPHNRGWEATCAKLSANTEGAE